MSDPFKLQSAGLSDPASTLTPVAPGAQTWQAPCRALYVGTGGTVVVITRGRQQVSFVNVPSGTILPVRAIGVAATSTATDIVALS